MAKSLFSFSASTVKSVVASFAKANNLEKTAKANRTQAGQKMVDDLTVACDMDDKAKYFDKVKARAACMEVFTKAGLDESAVKNYPMSVKLAFVHGVPFATSLFTKQGKESAGIATASAGTADNGKSGTVKTTNKTALFKTLSKALAQARLLDHAGFVGDLTDTIQAAFPDFIETVLNK
tara:strand:- start:277 stop:813 length:537 start_codon:yes stop_codon:yes gene_type:complete